MNTHIQHIQERIAPIKAAITKHKVYPAITTIDDVKVFMKHHVFAVWDFMSLLKSLQNSLTCTSLPWLPVGNATTRYLINEIVTGEEADVDEQGERMSHFELYQRAMQQAGADTAQIGDFIALLQQGKQYNDALDAVNAPQSVKDFVRFTFDIVYSNKPHVQAAVFCFGREDLIPDMFHSIVADISKQFPDFISTFKYYLERHIEVDGDHHSQLALEMTANLCGDNEAYWGEAYEAVTKSLEMRVKLWDGIYDEIKGA
jgi:Protein of unknown function (DUF3050).